MNSSPLPQGMTPLEYGNMLLGGANRQATDPFALQRNMAAQAAQAAQAQEDPGADTEALLEEVEQILKETSSSNKLKTLAVRLKKELEKSRELDAEIAADPEIAEILERLMAEGAGPETPQETPAAQR